MAEAVVARAWLVAALFHARAEFVSEDVTEHDCFNSSNSCIDVFWKEGLRDDLPYLMKEDELSVSSFDENMLVPWSTLGSTTTLVLWVGGGVLPSSPNLWSLLCYLLQAVLVVAVLVPAGAIGCRKPVPKIEQVWSCPHRESVDAIVAWVDPSDPSWQAAKQQRAGLASADCSAEDALRFQPAAAADLEVELCLEFCLRNGPAFRRVHVVTMRPQVPPCLQRNKVLRAAVESGTICVVFHDHFMPKEVLPTFNSHAIESCLHYINGLAENFLYFNDDFFVTRAVRSSQFFHGGRIVVRGTWCTLREEWSKPHNLHREGRRTLRHNIKNRLFLPIHQATPMTRSLMAAAEAYMPNAWAASRTPFRDPSNVVPVMAAVNVAIATGQAVNLRDDVITQRYVDHKRPWPADAPLPHLLCVNDISDEAVLRRSVAEVREKARRAASVAADAGPRAVAHGRPWQRPPPITVARKPMEVRPVGFDCRDDLTLAPLVAGPACAEFLDSPTLWCRKVSPKAAAPRTRMLGTLKTGRTSGRLH